LFIKQPVSLISLPPRSPFLFTSQSYLGDNFASIASTVVIRC
jgi:hypothetical protein